MDNSTSLSSSLNSVILSSNNLASFFSEGINSFNIWFLSFNTGWPLNGSCVKNSLGNLSTSINLTNCSNFSFNNLTSDWYFILSISCNCFVSSIICCKVVNKALLFSNSFPNSLFSIFNFSISAFKYTGSFAFSEFCSK